MRNLSEAEAAWLAGLYEGEGCTHLLKNGRGVNVTIAMTDRDVVERVHRLTGIGNVHLRPRARPTWSDQYAWMICAAADIRDFLRRIRPLLGERRGARVDEALERLAQVEGYRRRVRETARICPRHGLPMVRAGAEQRWWCSPCNTERARVKRARRREAAVR